MSASQWRQYRVESDELADAARRHAKATLEHHRQLIELYGAPAKTQSDWSMISQLIVSTRAGYDAATVFAQLSVRAAMIADTLERNENR